MCTETSVGLINEIPGTILAQAIWDSPRQFLSTAKESAQAKDSLDAVTLFGKLKDMARLCFPVCLKAGE